MARRTARTRGPYRSSGGCRGAEAARDSNTPNTISAELIGQVLNPSPAVGAQYGYVSYLAGLSLVRKAAPTFSGCANECPSSVSLVVYYRQPKTGLNEGGRAVVRTVLRPLLLWLIKARNAQRSNNTALTATLTNTLTDMQKP
jgi:hypothetical protein